MKKNHNGFVVGDHVSFVGHAINENLYCTLTADSKGSDYYEVVEFDLNEYKKLLPSNDQVGIKTHSGKIAFISKSQVIKVKRKNQKIYPKFEGYSYREGVGYKPKQTGKLMSHTSEKRQKEDTHAMFSIALSNLDKLTATQRKNYGVSK